MTWTQLINLLALVQACFVIGVSTLVLWHYAMSGVRRKAPRLFQHIVCIAISYIILTLRSAWAVWFGVIPLDDPWLYVLIAAFALGDFALIKVVMRQAYRRAQEHSTEF